MNQFRLDQFPNQVNTFTLQLSYLQLWWACPTRTSSQWTCSRESPTTPPLCKWVPNQICLFFLSCKRKAQIEGKIRFCQESVISLVLSRLTKNLKQWTLKSSAHHSSWTYRVIALGSWTDRVIAIRSVLQLRVTAQFYLENSRKIHPRGMRACWPKDTKRRESAPALWLLFLYVFSLPRACPV